MNRPPRRVALLLTLLLFFPPGCLTVSSSTKKLEVYGGVRTFAKKWPKGSSASIGAIGPIFASLWNVMAVFDLPFSLAADTVFLPVTAIASLARTASRSDSPAIPEPFRAKQTDRLLLRAAAFLAQGDCAGALTTYDEVLSLDPTVARAWFGRAQAFAGLGDTPQAIANYEHALAFDPGSTLRAELARLRANSGDLVGAAADYKRVARRWDPQTWALWLEYAEVLRRLGRAAEARAASAQGRRLRAQATGNN